MSPNNYKFLFLTALLFLEKKFALIGHLRLLQSYQSLFYEAPWALGREVKYVYPI